MIQDDPKCMEHSGFCKVIESFEKKISEVEKGAEDMDKRLTAVENYNLELKTTIKSMYWVGSFLVTACTFLGSYVIPKLLQ